MSVGNWPPSMVMYGVSVGGANEDYWRRQMERYPPPAADPLPAQRDALSRFAIVPGETIDELQKRIAAIEVRLAELEAKMATPRRRRKARR